MNLNPNISCQNPLDLASARVINLNPLSSVAPGRDAAPQDTAPCIDQREPATVSVTAGPPESAAQAANDAGPVQGADEPSTVVHFDQECRMHRFEAWLHGSTVLEAPLPARQLDSVGNEARALDSHLRAVRETSYLPARTSLLIM